MSSFIVQTFEEVYEEWSKKKFPTVSESNIKGYKASYKTCGILYNRVFKDLKLADLQQVIDTCGKNFPTLKKIKILFNQLYEFALKNDICTTLKIWTLATVVLYPLAGIIIINCFNIALWDLLNKIFLIMILGGMVVSIYIIGKKYE